MSLGDVMADFELVKSLQGVRESLNGPGYTPPAPPHPLESIRGQRFIPTASWSTGGGGGGSMGLLGRGGNANLKRAMQTAAQQRGWTGSEWNSLDELIQRESSWNPQAQNPTSTAWGLGQFLDMHWGPGKYLPNGRNSSNMEQINAIIRYVGDRYGSPSAAISHHNRMNWY